LLTRIREKSSNSSGKKLKPKLLHLRWERFDPEKEKYCLVKQNEGGGHRFVEVIPKNPVSFEEIKEKATGLYFDCQGKNYFQEDNNHCIITICEMSGNDLDLKEDVWKYLERKGLFLSKTHFILQSKDFNYIDDISDDEDTSISNIKDNIGLDLAHSVFPNICEFCCCTLEYGGM